MTEDNRIIYDNWGVVFKSSNEENMNEFINDLSELLEKHKITIHYQRRTKSNLFITYYAPGKSTN